ncbi:MAG: GNAT family N-acetyltransferase [Candidatus Izemoplasmatales bacterium]
MIPSSPVPLEKENYRGVKLPVSYATTGAFRVAVDATEDAASFRMTLTPFDEPRLKEYEMELYPPYFGNVEAYGIFDGEILAGCVEIAEETWSRRLRITELWVEEHRRLRGLGGTLLEFAKMKAVEKGCRLAILETQTCNLAAIALYRKHGFTFIGLDTTCYTDADVENDEVRVEMGWKTGVAG